MSCLYTWFLRVAQHPTFFFFFLEVGGGGGGLQPLSALLVLTPVWLSTELAKSNYQLHEEIVLINIEHHFPFLMTPGQAANFSTEDH